EGPAAPDAPRPVGLDRPRRSRIPGWFSRQAARLFRVTTREPALRGTADAERMRRGLARLGGWTVAGGAMLCAAWGAVHLLRLVTELRGPDWLTLAAALGLRFSAT